MARAFYTVVFSVSANKDLSEIIDYWLSTPHSELGFKYAVDLAEEAKHKLSDISMANAGRKAIYQANDDIKEILVFNNSYRIIYIINNATFTVTVLRFWHSKRGVPELKYE